MPSGPDVGHGCAQFTWSRPEMPFGVSSMLCLSATEVSLAKAGSCHIHPRSSSDFGSRCALVFAAHRAGHYTRAAPAGISKRIARTGGRDSRRLRQARRQQVAQPLSGCQRQVGCRRTSLRPLVVRPPCPFDEFNDVAVWVADIEPLLFPRDLQRSAHNFD